MKRNPHCENKDKLEYHTKSFIESNFCKRDNPIIESNNPMLEWNILTTETDIHLVKSTKADIPIIDPNVQFVKLNNLKLENTSNNDFDTKLQASSVGPTDLDCIDLNIEPSKIKVEEVDSKDDNLTYPKLNTIDIIKVGAVGNKFVYYVD